ncbi:MAG: Rpn family recombination-promoting nuclease/putative transposase, partial [Spirochaetota bacterium]|nr:Rpn family recombination-promoting nuclease/putative transposase [Spirochaetota bacterium]
IIRDDEVFHKAHDVYERFTKDEELKDLYESREEAERQHLTSLEIAEQKGIEKGIETEKLEIARAMLKKGLDIKFISELTELSEDQIRKLT